MLAPGKRGAGASAISVEDEATPQVVPVRWRAANPNACQAFLEQLDGLRSLPSAELALLAGCCSLRVYEQGSTLMIERSVPHAMFVILEGSVSMTVGEPEDRPVLIVLLGRGDVCGEGGLFGIRYRRATARAESRVYALQLQYPEIAPLLPDLPEFRARLHRSFRERLLQSTLAHVPLFNSLNALERLALSVELEDRQVERGATIIRQHDSDLSIYIIAEGQAQVVRDGQVLDVLGPGEMFGEMALIDNEPHSANVVAFTPLHVLIIPLQTFRQLLLDHPEIEAGLRSMVEWRYAAGHDPTRLNLVGAAATSGVSRSRQALARIPALCPPDCTLCEQACGSRFGQPRVRLGGVTLGDAEVLESCKHCAWSPECAEACPEDAIKLNDQGFLVVNDRCTGCGECVTACPYGGVTMIPLYPPVTGALDWLLRRVRPPIPVRMHANKCDGCHGYADQACFTACPTGSLRWITLEDVSPYGYQHAPADH